MYNQWHRYTPTRIFKLYFYLCSWHFYFITILLTCWIVFREFVFIDRSTYILIIILIFVIKYGNMLLLVVPGPQRSTPGSCATAWHVVVCFLVGGGGGLLWIVLSHKFGALIVSGQQTNTSVLWVSRAAEIILR